MFTPDVYAACAELDNLGVKFKKRPDEGSVKGVAFVFDPDGYSIEIIRRNPESPVKEKWSLAITMMRVKDAEKSHHFYGTLLGLNQRHHLDFSQAGFSCKLWGHGPSMEETGEKMPTGNRWDPCLALMHNLGTES